MNNRYDAIKSLDVQTSFSIGLINKHLNLPWDKLVRNKEIQLQCWTYCLLN